MRLMYLQVKWEDGLFKDTEISFDSEWAFKIGRENIHCRRDNELSVPQNFYALDSWSPVEMVNVVVGKNGCGKTTLAVILKEIFSGEKTDFSYVLVCKGQHMFFHDNVTQVQVDSEQGTRDQNGNEFRNEAWLVYSFDKRDGLSCKYARIEAGDEYVSKLKNLDYIHVPIHEYVDLVYCSPHFTTENPFRGTHGRMINLSPTGLFVENPLSNYNRIQLVSGVDSDVALGTYAYDERRRIIEFAAAFYGLDRERRKDVPFPMPIFVSLESDFDSINRLRGYFHDKSAHFKSERRLFQSGESDKAYDELERMCDRIRSIIDYAASNYLVVTIIVGYVAAYCADCNLLGSYHEGRFASEYGAGLVDVCGENFKELLRETEKKQDGVVLEYFCRSLVALKRKLNTTKHSDAVYGGRERNALRFFLRLRKLIKRCPPKYLGIDRRLVVEIADDVSFNMFREVVRWHRHAMVFSTFIKIDFAPKLSSGEVSYLTLYGRLASHFIYGNSIAASDRPNKDAVVFIDEAETTLHPLWQKNLLWNVLWFFENFSKRFKIHLILASHSPMLISDVPIAHCIMLERWGAGRDARTVCADLKTKKSSLGLTSTFAANIFDLYRSSFFMDDGLVGKFAQEKLDKIMAKARRIISGATTEVMTPEDWRTLELVGDPVAKRYFTSIKKLVGMVQE